MSAKRTIHLPKNGRECRVDISGELADALSALQRARKAEHLAKGENTIPARVFLGKGGSYVDVDWIRRKVCWPALAKAGLHRIRIHDLRHTTAALLIQAGEPLVFVRDLGHSSIKITADVYGRLTPGANRQAVDRLPGLAGAPQSAESGNQWQPLNGCLCI